MVFKKSFTLLVATGTTMFFALVSLISDQHCSSYVAKLIKLKRGYKMDCSHKMSYSRMRLVSFLFFLQLKTQRKTQVFGDNWHLRYI